MCVMVVHMSYRRHNFKYTFPTNPFAKTPSLLIFVQRSVTKVVCFPPSKISLVFLYLGLKREKDVLTPSLVFSPVLTPGGAEFIFFEL